MNGVGGSNASRSAALKSPRWKGAPKLHGTNWKRYSRQAPLSRLRDPGPTWGSAAASAQREAVGCNRLFGGMAAVIPI
jgi:hypothetical protein